MAVEYSEDNLLPVSALQHLAFCERQWGLIYLEQAWAENILTAEGQLLHQKAHDGSIEMRGDIMIVRGLRVRSLRLGLVGMLDVVEFEKADVDVTPPDRMAVSFNHMGGLWRPVPVEYKRGKPKPDDCDKVQLCAQALCLEEMLDVTISFGAIFYGVPRRRLQVEFDAALRKKTKALSARLHRLYDQGKTPLPVYSKKCSNCSLIDICKPKVFGPSSSPLNYIDAIIKECIHESDNAGMVM